MNNFMTNLKQFEIWIADLNPQRGTEAGKVRPVIIIQTDLLNKKHPSTIICPITTNVQPEAQILRVHIEKSTFGLQEKSDIMIDQMRAIDNKRLLSKIGEVDKLLKKKIKDNLKIVLDLH